MKTYTVSYEIELDANDPISAAKLAYEWLTDNQDQVFIVTDKSNNNKTTVDLADHTPAH